MSSPTSQYSPAFHSFFNKEKTSAETATKLDFISYIWDDDHIRRLDGKTGNAYGVIEIFKKSILLRLLLTYWGRRVCKLKVVMFLRTNLQELQNYKQARKGILLFFWSGLQGPIRAHTEIGRASCEP